LGLVRPQLVELLVAETNVRIDQSALDDDMVRSGAIGGAIAELAFWAMPLPGLCAPLASQK
jgi:hypothetical protein